LIHRIKKSTSSVRFDIQLSPRLRYALIELVQYSLLSYDFLNLLDPTISILDSRVGFRTCFGRLLLKLLRLLGTSSQSVNGASYLPAHSTPPAENRRTFLFAAILFQTVVETALVKTLGVGFQSIFNQLRVGII